MTLESPKAIAFGGTGTAMQVAARARKKGAVLAVTTTTGNAVLPLSSNGQPFRAFMLTNVGADPVYWSLGGSVAITAAATATNFDDVIAAGVAYPIVNDDRTTVATHIAGITASGAGTLIIVGLV